MRTLSSTLTTKQKSKTLTPLIKVVLSHNSTTYTYTKERIRDINHPEEPFSQTVELVLDNSDGVLTNIDLQGFQAVVSYGVLTKAGEEYSACAPMKVLSQNFDTSPGKMDCRLRLFGIPNQMAYDEASESYMPESSDTKTVKTLLTQIIGATLTCFSHCEAFDIVWDSEDSLIDTYKPKDSFRIYVGGKRLPAIRRLLEYTKCVMRFEADGKAHIFEPVTSGSTYDYEYSLDGGHSFFSKAYRNRLVLPNYQVVQSQPDDDPQYSGWASDADSYALLPKRAYKQIRLESNDQATAIAEAIIAQHQLWSDMGSADVPMNVGAEVFNYVKVGALNSNDVYRVGNLGHLCRHYNAERSEWRMTFSFGNWMTVRKALADIGIMDPGDIEAYFDRLMVKDLYAENIMADNIDMIWLDPEGNIDLSLIGDDLDSLPDGEVYARVKSLHMDAGIIRLDESIFYKSGYDPTDKFDLVGNDLDDIPEGTVYQRVKSAALTAAGLVILDQVIVGTYGLVLSTDIAAGHIRLQYCVGDLDDIEDGSTYEKIKGTDISSGHIKLSTTIKDGAWYSEHGVEIDADSGITFNSGVGGLQICRFKYGTEDGWIWLASTGILIVEGEEGVQLRTLGGSKVISLRSTGELRPGGNYGLGSSSYRWGKAYIEDLDVEEVNPRLHETYDCGDYTKAWYKVCTKWLYTKSTSWVSYQKHDDIALLKAIKSKREEGKDVIDVKTLPGELVMDNGYVNIAGVQGLSIGVMKSLLARIEVLEAKIEGF